MIIDHVLDVFDLANLYMNVLIDLVERGSERVRRRVLRLVLIILSSSPMNYRSSSRHSFVISGLICARMCSHDSRASNLICLNQRMMFDDDPLSLCC